MNGLQQRQTARRRCCCRIRLVHCLQGLLFFVAAVSLVSNLLAVSRRRSLAAEWRPVPQLPAAFWADEAFRRETRRFLAHSLDPTAPENGYHSGDSSVVQFRALLSSFAACSQNVWRRLEPETGGGAEDSGHSLGSSSSSPLLLLRSGLGTSWIIDASAELAGVGFAATTRLSADFLSRPRLEQSAVHRPPATMADETSRRRHMPHNCNCAWANAEACHPDIDDGSFCWRGCCSQFSPKMAASSGSVSSAPEKSIRHPARPARSLGRRRLKGVRPLLLWADGWLDAAEHREWTGSMQHHPAIANAAVSFGLPLYGSLGDKMRHWQALHHADLALAGTIDAAAAELNSAPTGSIGRPFSSTFPKTLFWSSGGQGLSPEAVAELKEEMLRKPRGLWFIKPVRGSNGKGVHVISAPEDLPGGLPPSDPPAPVTSTTAAGLPVAEEPPPTWPTWLVQRYIDPLLLSSPGPGANMKFDIRFHAIVRFSPLRVYMHDDGFVRFASVAWLPGKKNISNKCMHLTAAGWQSKACKAYRRNRNASATDTSSGMWSWHAMAPRLRESGWHPERLWEKVSEAVVRNVVAAATTIDRSHAAELERGVGAWQLIGPDVTFDSSGNAMVEEINVFPALDGYSPLDLQVKLRMLVDAWWLLLATNDTATVPAVHRVRSFCAGEEGSRRCGAARPSLTGSSLAGRDMARRLLQFEAELCQCIRGGFDLAYPTRKQLTAGVFDRAKQHWSGSQVLERYVWLYGTSRREEECFPGGPPARVATAAAQCREANEGRSPLPSTRQPIEAHGTASPNGHGRVRDDDRNPKADGAARNVRNIQPRSRQSGGLETKRGMMCDKLGGKSSNNAEFPPACPTSKEVKDIWGVGGHNYNQSKCRENYVPLKAMLEAVRDFLRSENITAWWVDGGTLIGLARHNGHVFIPWDHDADIAVVVDEELPGALRPATYVKVIMKFNEFMRKRRSGGRKSHYVVEECAPGYDKVGLHDGMCSTSFKIHPGPAERGAGSAWVPIMNLRGPVLDLFPSHFVGGHQQQHRKTSNRSVVLKYLSSHASWGKYRLDPHTILPTADCGDVLDVDPEVPGLRCPRDPLSYLNYYSPGWCDANPAENQWTKEGFVHRVAAPLP